MNRLRLRLLTLSAVAGAVIATWAIVHAGTDVEVLTYDAIGCYYSSGAYGTAWAWDDSEAGGGTVGNSSCPYRRVDGVSVWRNGDWVAIGGLQGWGDQFKFDSQGNYAPAALAVHRICSNADSANCGDQRWTGASW